VLPLTLNTPGTDVGARWKLLAAALNGVAPVQSSRVYG
jgi:hypothetical protein